MDVKPAHFFLFAFSLSIVLSERAKVNEAQEHRNDADRSRRHSAQMFEQQAKNQRKFGRKSLQNRPKIDEKSILGGFGRSRSFQGRVRTRSGRFVDGQKLPKGRS
jgi:hypothetical protein